eukprot:SAG11_NODE_36840_length_259_cov_1.606250_2_plen_27_part_01
MKTQLKWLNDLMGENTFICGSEITVCD